MVIASFERLSFQRGGLLESSFGSKAAGQDSADGCPYASGTGDVQIAADGGDSLSH
jgi:hypothetical protein